MSRAFDNDGDSQMQSSNSTSPEDTTDLFPSNSKPSTPVQQTGFPHLAELSPPNSQGGVALPTAASAATPRGANANGKRPLSTLDSNGDAIPVLRGVDGAGIDAAGEAAGPVKTHAASGYSWTKAEDEPGWSWMNKKAAEDASRAWDLLVGKERRIGNRYGDPFEMADRELAVMRSQKQR